MTAWMKTEMRKYEECPNCHSKTLYAQRGPTGVQMDVDDLPKAVTMRCRKCGYREMCE